MKDFKFASSFFFCIDVIFVKSSFFYIKRFMWWMVREREFFNLTKYYHQMLEMMRYV